jgi:acetyl-CoA carboxylase biotin carboxyl carrier protein
MDVKTITRLAEVMSQHQLTELEVDDGQMKLRMGRQGNVPVAQTPAAANEAGGAPAANAAPVAAANEQADDAAAQINSPLVGTFYAAPTPESAPFVSVGSVVEADTVVCIVEAMKVMNEIKAEVGGTIVKTLVSNGSAVEYGQPLFEIKLG